jgi:parallel beta-helix repeat protein
VQVAVGASIQAAVNNNPGNTTFCLAAGRHVAQTVIPKPGNIFRGALGSGGAKLTILDGNLTAQHSIYVGTGSVATVTIRDLIVERYNTPLQRAAVGGYGLVDSLIENLEVRNNKAGGVSFGSRTVVRNNWIHHNEQTGMYANGASDALVQGNEISWNNYLKLHDPYWEAGGSKFLNTTRLTLRGNHVHDNHGPGLWLDHNNVDAVYEDNRLINNNGPGIFHEISHAADIRNNYLEGNGFGFTAWLDGSGILVNSSDGVEIYGNTLVNNNDGIGATYTNRGTEWHVRDLYVHDNTITQSTGKAAGIVTNLTGTGVFTTFNNRFENNDYDVPNPQTSQVFEWANGARTWTQWQGFGQDLTGSVS